MILDYSEYRKSSATKGIVNYVQADKNLPLFQHKPICPFCHIEIHNKVYSNQRTDYPDWLFGSFDQFESVIQCPKCGWWEYSYRNQSDAIIDGIRASDIEYVTSILKEYNDESMEAPISTIRAHLEQHPDLLYRLNPHKFAEVVRSIYRDYFPNCDVLSFGKTHDGGRDGLIVLNNGQHYLLQVKRRTNPIATEGVNALRELVGVSVIDKKASGCIFVTTADHFSKPAEKYAREVLDNQVVERFDLVDCKEFLDLLNLTKDHLPTKWNEFVRLQAINTISY